MTGRIDENVGSADAGHRTVDMSNQTNGASARAAWMLLLLVILASAAVRVGFLAVPLDRDEGDYAHGARLMLEGTIPYQQFYQMKLPGTYLAYAAAIATFGPTQVGVHLGLLVVNALTSLFVFLLARRLVDPLTGVLAAAGFSTLSLGYPVQGFSANTEHYVILPAVAGLWLVLEALARKRRGLLFGAGLLLGVAFLMKQHGIVFAAVAASALVLDRDRERPPAWRRIGSGLLVLGGGFALPYASMLVYFAAVGALGDFWFWTVTYPQGYLAQVPISRALSNFADVAVPTLRVGWPLWALAAIGVAALPASPRLRPRRALLSTFAVLSFAAIVPGFVFRAHYLVLVLPAVAVLSAAGATALVDTLLGELAGRRRFACACLVVAAAVAASLFAQRDYLFHTTPFTASRFVFGRNPFPESLEIAEHIRADTSPTDAIAVLGSEPQIYFYAGRPPATGHVYMYPLMESHPHALEMQEQLIREIESARPRYIVWVDPQAVPWSWLVRPESHRRVLEWFQAYRARHYERVGLVEFTRTGTRSRWGADARGEPESDHWVEVLRRRAD